MKGAILLGLPLLHIFLSGASGKTVQRATQACHPKSSNVPGRCVKREECSANVRPKNATLLHDEAEGSNGGEKSDGCSRKDGLVCCALMAKIVTPAFGSVPIPIVQQPLPPPQPQPLPQLPQYTQQPQTPQLPQYTQQPQTPQLPQEPFLPQAPQLPQVPEVPQVPQMPEVPQVPQQPPVPQVPQVPQLPPLTQPPQELFTSRPYVPQPVSSIPYIDPGLNPNPYSEAIVNAKCEEYTHNMIKRATIETYIFGGTESFGGEFRHMAALGYGELNHVDWLCGGSLISDRFVLTAAHCLFQPYLGELIIVRLGDLNLKSTTDDASPQDIMVEQKMMHPGYQIPAQYNDIGLLKLATPAQFNGYVGPICVQASEYLPNTNFVAVGWGRKELGGPPSDTLMKVDLQYFPSDKCRLDYATVSVESLPRGIEDASQLCAGSYTEEKDTCQGDSGGPLQIMVTDVPYLVGITSFGKGCGIPNTPGVYTRVSRYISWIQQTVWP